MSDVTSQSQSGVYSLVTSITTCCSRQTLVPLLAAEDLVFNPLRDQRPVRATCGATVRKPSRSCHRIKSHDRSRKKEQERLASLVNRQRSDARELANTKTKKQKQRLAASHGVQRTKLSISHGKGHSGGELASWSSSANSSRKPSLSWVNGRVPAEQ